MMVNKVKLCLIIKIYGEVWNAEDIEDKEIQRKAECVCVTSLVGKHINSDKWWMLSWFGSEANSKLLILSIENKMSLQKMDDEINGAWRQRFPLHVWLWLGWKHRDQARNRVGGLAGLTAHRASTRASHSGTQVPCSPRQHLAGAHVCPLDGNATLSVLSSLSYYKGNIHTIVQKVRNIIM